MKKDFHPPWKTCWQLFFEIGGTETSHETKSSWSEVRTRDPSALLYRRLTVASCRWQRRRSSVVVRRRRRRRLARLRPKENESFQPPSPSPLRMCYRKFRTFFFHPESYLKLGLKDWLKKLFNTLRAGPQKVKVSSEEFILGNLISLLMFQRVMQGATCWFCMVRKEGKELIWLRMSWQDFPYTILLSAKKGGG